MQKIKSQSKSNSQRAGVLLEFIVVVPVLILICLSLLDVGQAFGQRAWLESVAYQSVMTGGELVEHRTESMVMMSDGLVDTLHVRLDKKFVTPGNATTATEDNSARTVTSNIPGEMKLFSALYSIPYQVSLTGPMLVRNERYTVNEVPANDPGVNYDCFGEVIDVDSVDGKDCIGPIARNECRCACIGQKQGTRDDGCY